MKNELSFVELIYHYSNRVLSEPVLARLKELLRGKDSHGKIP